MGMLFRLRPAATTMAVLGQTSVVAPDSAAVTSEGSAWRDAMCLDGPLANQVRAQRLVRAVEASVTGASNAIADLYTDDVQGWSPAGTISSAAELAVEFEDRDDAFSDVEITVVALDVGGDQACVEWVASVVHSGALVLEGNVLVRPTGRRLTLRGATVADFDGDRIRAFRQYWNEMELLDQIRAAAEECAPH